VLETHPPTLRASPETQQHIDERGVYACKTQREGTRLHTLTLLHVWLLVPDGVWSYHTSSAAVTLAASQAPRLDYKVSCLVHQSLSYQAPRYLADDINLAANSGRRLLRSAYDRTCAVPRTYTGFGERNFSVAGPRVWIVERSAAVFATRH